MYRSSFLPSLFVVFACCLLSSSVNALNSVSISGNMLVDSVTGSRFMMHGMGYDYTVDNDNEANWKSAMTELLATVPNINTIRIYVVDESKPHDKFMTWAADNNIYVIAPLTPSESCVLNRDGSPDLQANHTCYPSCLLTYGQKVVNIFSQFDNTLAFTIGNEIMDKEERWAAAPCVKAYTKDIKAFIRGCSQSDSMRTIPIVYAAADNPLESIPSSSTPYNAEENDLLKLDYLTCGDDDDAKIDLFGLNVFRWCADTCTYESCGWKRFNEKLASNAAGIPMVLTEYGCSNFAYVSQGNTIGQRSWTQVPVLFGQNMVSAWSGGCAYTYGTRGGTDFSFFSNADSSSGAANMPTATPPTTKTCGFPNNVCNVDNYAKQLSGIGTSFSKTTSSSKGSVSCPTVGNIDLTLPPSRQGADGYTEVQCAAGGTSTPSTSTSSSTSNSSSSTSSSSNSTSSTSSTASGTSDQSSTKHSGSSSQFAVSGSVGILISVIAVFAASLL